MTLRPDPDAQSLSHRDDPDTSREAAQKKAESGTLESDRDMALSLVRHFPGHTVVELVWKITYNPPDYERERQRIGRRMSELAKAGLIHARGQRDRGRLWWPGPEPEDAKQGALFEAPRRLVMD